MTSPKKAEAPVEYRWTTLNEAEAHGIVDLVHMHHEEVSNDGLPLDLDWPEYRRLERLGIYKPFAAFCGGQLIGYNAFFVQPTIHHKSTLIAENDVLYLTPSERRGMTGVLLVTKVKPLLEAMGVRKIRYADKPYLNLGKSSSNATLGDMLSKLGYGLSERLYELNL